MNVIKRSLAMLLTLCMLFSAVPTTAFADEADSTIPAVTEPVAETTEATTASTEETTVPTEETTVPTEEPAEATEDSYAIATTAVEIKEASLSYADAYRILHLDCGRKYFTVDWIKALINEMAAAGFTHLELAFGNDNLRFLLDDMSVGNYSNEQVTAAIQAGNAAKHGAGELTQSEMTAIITHANSKGIKIIPLLNNPGHMNAIVSAASSLTRSSAGYNGSSGSTVNLENDDAVDFVKGLVEKYVAYFDGMGCNEFNFGADEYANDVYPNGSMGFGALTYAGKYQLFVNYVNEMAAMIKGYGMVPIAFNDGIYFNQDTDYNFDKQIAVAFWTSGWSGYQSASASTMAGLGHKMINVNGDYYYILGKSDQWDSNGYTYAANWNNSAFMGSYVSDPMGGMFCIWCDYPNAETETQIAANNRLILRAMAAEMQGEDGTAVSDEVIPGGFNADGTIAEDCNNVTVKDETSTGDAAKVEVTACGLTSVTTVVAEAPTIEGAANVLAWDITPYAGEEKYEGGAIVKLPVPNDWDANLVRGFYMENGSAVQVTGTYADGFYTFKMPHFSVGGLMLLDASTQYDQLIELNVGDTHEIVIKNVNYNGEYATNPTGIATVVAVHEEKEATGSVTPVTSPSDGSDYYIINNGKYLAANLSWVENISDAVAWRTTYFYGYYMFSYNNAYLGFDYSTNSWVTTNSIYDDNTELFILSGDVLEGDRSWQIITLATSTGSVAVNQSTITITGIAPGTTYSTVGDTTYKIVVHGTIAITIKYQTANGTVIKTETVSVADNATTYAVSNFNHNGKFYTVADTALPIDPKNTTTYTVTVTEVEEDLSTVTPMTIEFWQTNAIVNAPDQTSGNSLVITAEDAYSEEGLSLLGKIPTTGYKDSTPVVYWRSRMLAVDERQQNGAGAADRTWTGTGFTKVRYWNGSWAVYTEAGEWMNITLADYQLVAYYMNDMNLADEVKVGTSDWGKKGNVSPDDASEGYVSIVYQVVYEDGTCFPADITTAEVGDYSYIVNAWRNSAGQVQRGVGTIALTQVGDYEIWKVTAETGEHTLTGNNTIGSITWDNNEQILFEDKDNPISQYTIYNPSQPQNVIKDSDHQNLYWDEQNESILIRIYLATEETEDSLKVVYYDEKFGAVLEEFNISVESGHNFNDNIVNVSTGNTEDPPVFTYQGDDGSTVTVAARVDATGYGIVNALEKTQNFETNLANVAITNNRYNADLYMYTGSVISEDGKTITHYYNINQEALSPNFVADFGLPLTFNLSDVVKEGIDTVENVTVTPTTKFGTLEYNSDKETFTYTPTKILTTVDVLTISILFDGQKTATTTNVGVTPATTVHYEESFITWGSGWTGGTTKPAMTQNTAVLGEDTNNYGYDSAYNTVTGASNATTSTIGATGSFTFTGNGIQVFANATESSGYVSVQVKNSSGAIVNMAMVDTIVDKGTTSVTEGQTGSLYGLPIVSLIDLQNMRHDTYTVTLTKIMDTEPVYIDGIRVFNTVEDSTIFAGDREDNPEFYELRDYVLNALSIGTGAKLSADELAAVVDQVYAAISSDTEAPASAVITSGSDSVIADTATAQDLLDNGPKNELYLYAGQTLTFKVTSSRIMQIGLKAPKDATTASVSINGGTATEQAVMSSVDMFYNLVSTAANTDTEYIVSITNTGDTILSVTLLKVCDDPSFAFASLTSEDIEKVLTGVYGLTDDEETETPVEPSAPEEETPTEPEIPEETPEPETKPSKPSKPSKPGKPGSSKPGKPGSSKPGNSNRPGRPVEDREPAEEAVLNIVFINLWGRKVGTATLTESGNENDRCVFSASEISAQAPGNYWALWSFPAIISYGDTATIIVTVL